MYIAYFGYVLVYFVHNSISFSCSAKLSAHLILNDEIADKVYESKQCCARCMHQQLLDRL